MPDNKNQDKEPLQEAEELQENAAPEVEQPADEGEELQDQMKDLENQLSSLNDKYLRILAEYDNFRKRSQKEKDAIYPRAVADTVEKFLPILDNFDRAMEVPSSDETFRKGVEMIQQAFLNTLKDLGVELIGAEGETFDPQLHNAVMHIDDESYGENVIVKVLQKGYRMGDKVIRYAMVQVAN